ncbi:hypothetical protein FORC71_1405 [Vibrio parahaemolyticus]|nr:hypothetical protein FORC71_1405 [Vibrio parahaemolyticus]
MALWFVVNDEQVTGTVIASNLSRVVFSSREAMVRLPCICAVPTSDARRGE